MDSHIQQKVAETCIRQFNFLPKTGKPKENEWTVLSCIVKEQSSIFQVVSLGTGSKCIGKTKMCPKGTIVNDSHAEVMCRRAFLRYIYAQLRDNSLIFLLDRQKMKFVLKPEIRFHFFTTHVPCGDAAIFPKQQNEDFGCVLQPKCSDHDLDEIPVKKSKMNDIFRTGAKCLQEDIKQDLKGEGNDYHVVGVVRTKPGRGDPTMSVSCSDKLAKWCHLGIQGTLLMLLLETPIYLTSFTILNGTPFCQQALERALFKRLGNPELIKPYTRNVLDVYTVDLEFICAKKNDMQPCSSSIAWFQNDKDKTLEVAVSGRKQGITKKHYLTEKGRLMICKLELFKMFVQKQKEFLITLDFISEIEKISYGKAKKVNNVYQKNWQILQKKFGAWTTKDPTLLEFYAA